MKGKIYHKISLTILLILLSASLTTQIIPKKRRTYENDRDREEAERQEKMHELMKKNKKKNYEIFNKNLEKETLDLIKVHLLNLKKMRDKVISRQERRKMGIFILNKKFTKNEILLIFIILLSITITMIALNTIYKRSRKYFDKVILYSVTATASDLLFTLIFLIFLSILSEENYMISFQEHLNLEEVIVGGMSILIIWVFRAIIKMIYCQWKVNKWDYFEGNYYKKEEIVKEFLELCEKDIRSRKEEKRLKEITKILEYFNLREDFVYPRYLPVLRESVFRGDFPFSDYLCLCLGKDLRVYFRLKKSSYFTIFFVIVYMVFCSLLENTLFMGIFLSLLPIFCAFILLKIRQRFNLIYRMCLSRTKDKDLIQFAYIDNDFKIDSYPKFLKNPYKTKGKVLPVEKYKSKQEELFWMDSPAFMLNIIHQCEIVLISTFVISFQILGYLFDNDKISFWIATVSMISHSIVALFYAPGMLVKHSITSNIILMRDFNLANRAIDLQRARIFKYYRIFYR